MATRPTRRARAGASQGAPASQPRPKPPTAFQSWIEEAWHGWLKPVVLIATPFLLFVFYQTGVIGEHVMGLLLSLGVAFGALAIAVVQARGHVKTPGQRVLLWGLVIPWVLCAGYPILLGTFPGTVAASGHLAGHGAQITLMPTDGGKELYVLGKLRGNGEAGATYKISGTWQGGARSFEGALSRSVSRVRLGRRGSGISVTEHTEQKHYLGQTRGPVTLKLDSLEGSLENDLSVELRAAPVPPIALITLAGLVFATALALDLWLDPKARTGLGVAAAISLVFALYYGLDQARPHSVVAPAVGTFILAMATGGLGSWLLSTLVRQLIPERKQRPSRA